MRPPFYCSHHSHGDGIRSTDLWPLFHVDTSMIIVGVFPALSMWYFTKLGTKRTATCDDRVLVDTQPTFPTRKVKKSVRAGGRLTLCVVDSSSFLHRKLEKCPNLFEDRFPPWKETSGVGRAGQRAPLQIRRARGDGTGTKDCSRTLTHRSIHMDRSSSARIVCVWFCHRSNSRIIFRN